MGGCNCSYTALLWDAHILYQQLNRFYWNQTMLWYFQEQSFHFPGHYQITTAPAHALNPFSIVAPAPREPELAVNAGMSYP